MQTERATTVFRALRSGMALATLVALFVFGFFNSGRFNQIPSETASAGNGGVATASASGGVVSVGDINSGANRGNTILAGSTMGW